MNAQQLQHEIERLDEWQRVAIANIVRMGLTRHDMDALIAKTTRAIDQKINELIQQTK